jgi:hypothetical protein
MAHGACDNCGCAHEECEKRDGCSAAMARKIADKVFPETAAEAALIDTLRAIRDVSTKPPQPRRHQSG